MKNTTTTALVAVGALLVGGMATAAFMNHRGKTPEVAASPALTAPVAAVGDAPGSRIEPAATSAIQYAEVLKVEPVREKQTRYATVIGTEPVKETTTTSVPHEVCNDVVVQERLPERDGNVGGTVVGAVVGGLLGNQVGKGDGRKLATVAGAVAGGAIGNRMDKNHVGGKVVNKTERQCHTEQATSESSRVTGYNVTYRNPDGTTGTMRMDKKPDGRIPLGNDSKVVGYDVTYRYQGVEKTARMEHQPEGDRLPVLDGQLVTQTASVGGDAAAR